MGHLDRYKKSGGFLQLLELIESFQAAKQEKFLGLVQDENPIWAKALREKMLTVERISAWPAATLAEIFPHMNISLLAMAMHGFKPEQKEHFLSGLPASEKRKIQSEFEIVKPQPQDIVTTHYKLVELVRRLVKEGHLRLESIDPSAVINEKVEEALLRSSSYVRGESEESDMGGEIGRDVSSDLVREAVRGSGASASGTSAANADASPGRAGVASEMARGAEQSRQMSQEVKSLQVTVVNLQKENKMLKAEMKSLKDRLEAIRKIA